MLNLFIRYATCEDYVANDPHAYDDAYWLVNSVKVYQRSEDIEAGTGSAIMAVLDN